MRIRTIKPEFWRSDDVTSLAIEDRLLFIGLWSYVDDNGVGLDRLASITADLFAGDLEKDSSETFARVSRGLSNLFEAGRITRYTVDRRPYLAIVNWGKHQRIDKPGKDRYPLPDQAFSESSRDTREVVESVSRLEQGNRGTGEQGNRGTDLLLPDGSGDSFDEFYGAYPRKVGKDAARRAFEKAVRRASSSVVLAGVHRFANDPNLPDKQFIPHPATWLNAGQWADEPLPPRRGNRPNQTPEQRMRATLALVPEMKEIS